VKGVRTIDDLLRAKHLSAEELELHKELIEQCKERERNIAVCRVETENNLERFARAAEIISQRTTELENALQALVEQTDNLYLKLIPEDHFFHE
jgi:hypothetical protein